VKITLEEKVFHNLAWAQFLRALPTDADRDLAGLVMSWVKETYPQFAEILNGDLISIKES